jgi:hypothetical protein
VVGACHFATGCFILRQSLRSHCFTTVSQRLNVQQRTPAKLTLHRSKTQTVQHFAPIALVWHAPCASACHIQ